MTGDVVGDARLCAVQSRAFGVPEGRDPCIVLLPVGFIRVCYSNRRSGGGGRQAQPNV